jgi:hypothetical protein
MGGSESGTGLPKAGPHGWLIERETPLSTPERRNGRSDDEMMRTGRSGDRQSPLRVVRVTARETDWEPNPRTASRPAAIRAASMGRTYDRNRPTRINNQKLLPEGGVHIRL